MSIGTTELGNADDPPQCAWAASSPSGAQVGQEAEEGGTLPACWAGTSAFACPLGHPPPAPVLRPAEGSWWDTASVATGASPSGRIPHTHNLLLLLFPENLMSTGVYEEPASPHVKGLSSSGRVLSPLKAWVWEQPRNLSPLCLLLREGAGRLVL